MADDSSNGSNIVAIFAIIIIAGLAFAAFMFVAPRMMQKPPADGMKIQVELPKPEMPTEPAPAPQQ